MAAFDFPSNPSNGDVYNAPNGKQYTYNSANSCWRGGTVLGAQGRQGSPGAQGSTGAQGAQGRQGSPGAQGSTGSVSGFAIAKQVESNGTGANPNDLSHQSGSWITRKLNTEVDPSGIISLSGDVITINAGTWMVGWSAPSYYTKTHQTRLQISTQSNFSSSVTTVYGSSEDDGTGYHVGSPPGQTRSMGKHAFVAGTTSYIRLQHRFEWHTTVHQTNRLGKPTNFSTGEEVYGIVDLWKM